MKKNFAFLLLLCLLHPPASADGGYVGNGGDGVVCFKDIGVRNRVGSILQANRNAKEPTDPFDQPTLDNIINVTLLDLVEAGGDSLTAQSDDQNILARAVKTPTDEELAVGTRPATRL